MEYTVIITLTILSLFLHRPSGLYKLYSLSYLWLGLFGFTLAVIIGVPVSLITGISSVYFIEYLTNQYFPVDFADTKIMMASYLFVVS